MMIMMKIRHLWRRSYEIRNARRDRFVTEQLTLHGERNIAIMRQLFPRMTREAALEHLRIELEHSFWVYYAVEECELGM